MKTYLAAAIVLAASTIPALAEHASGSTSHRFPPAPKAAHTIIKPGPLIANAKRAIVSQLKDPESVRWRGAAVDARGNVCIEVNARNSYGGYTGFEVVLVAANGDIVWNDMAYGQCLGLKWRGDLVRVQ